MCEKRGPMAKSLNENQKHNVNAPQHYFTGCSGVGKYFPQGDAFTTGGSLHPTSRAHLWYPRGVHPVRLHVCHGRSTGDCGPPTHSNGRTVGITGPDPIEIPHDPYLTC